MKQETKEKYLQVKEQLDNITISNEVIEHLNQLINDKLDELNYLEFCNTNELALKLHEVLRYKNNYITLSHLIDDQVQNIYNRIQITNDLVNELQTLKECTLYTDENLNNE